MTRQIGLIGFAKLVFLAQAIWPAGRRSQARLDAKIAQLICPSGNSVCVRDGVANSTVVLAKARTHTAEAIGEARLVDDRAYDFGLW